MILASQAGDPGSTPGRRMGLTPGDNKMIKRGLSPLVGTVLLISLTVIIGVTIYSMNSQEILKLAPDEPQGCDFVSFQIDLYDSGDAFSLDVVNLGAIEIKGFTIREISEGDISDVENVERVVEPGKTESIPLAGSYSGRYLIVPRIAFDGLESDEEEIGVCLNVHGAEIEV